METDVHQYMRLLAEKYPTEQAATAEIINLDAILRLPKGTEHFMSDIHGEYEAFCHIMNTCSGVIREKVETLFGKLMTKPERDEFATLIYYPHAILAEMKARHADGISEWYAIQLHRLIEVCKTISSKYTRSKVRKSLPPDYGYIIDELINMDRSDFNKEAYYDEIFDSMIGLGCAEAFIVALCQAIKRLAVDTLHIVGDLFDRGNGPDRILDLLMQHHNVDIQWGNHDILWMGAYMGSDACMLTAVELSLKYGNMDVLEEGYGISLRALAAYAGEQFDADPRFLPQQEGGVREDAALIARMRKAVFFLLMKAEGQILSRHPEYEMEDRNLLLRIDYKAGTVKLGDTAVALNRTDFETVDPADPLAFTPAERRILERLRRAFTHSEKLGRHIGFLAERGSAFRVSNGNLIFHGCVPLCEDGSYRSFCGHAGPDLMAYADAQVRRTWRARQAGQPDRDGLDFLWYLWCGKCSPLFGREKLASFERLYVDDPRWHREVSNPYYRYCQDRAFCERLLRDFGITGKYSHIINGHVPVRKKDGENPVKADGKLIVIDGGMCRAYHEKTGIAGYTLIYNSHGLKLCAHEPFDSIAAAIEHRRDIHSEVTVFETREHRLRVRDTDTGEEIRERIAGLQAYLDHRRSLRLL